MNDSLINATHDPTLRSWVSSANFEGTDFPLQNLPFARFFLKTDDALRIGVAIGDQVLDLCGSGLFQDSDMQELLQYDAATLHQIRQTLSDALNEQVSVKNSNLHQNLQSHLYPQAEVQFALPCEVKNYTDFYIGIHHATAVGKLFRPDNPLLPNYRWVPIGYHGRASTLLPHSKNFHRPCGQVIPAGAQTPQLRPSARLDFELELGFVIGHGNVLGEAIPIDRAEEHLFGVCLLNDWSARDIQAWEYQPLGPFLSKNFASTLSPWLITLEALAPFRTSIKQRTNDEPEPLAYLNHSPETRALAAFDIALEVWLETAQMRARGDKAQQISSSNAAQAAYWSAAQLITHHSINGCQLQSGDLLGSGTLSGADATSMSGSLLELTAGGKNPLQLSQGEQRTFLQDYDSITLKGYCKKEGFRRIGLGECSAQVLPALENPLIE